MAIGAKVKVRVVVVPMVWLWDGDAVVAPPIMVWSMAIRCGQRRWYHHLAELARILSSGRRAAAADSGDGWGRWERGVWGRGSNLGWGLVINGGAAHHGLWMAIGGPVSGAS